MEEIQKPSCVRSPVSFSLFLWFYLSSAPLDNPPPPARWKTRHDRAPLSIQFSPSWRGVVAKKADRPAGRFVFSRLFLSRAERKMMKVAHGKKGGKKKKGKREEARADFPELLMAGDSEKTPFPSAGAIFHFAPQHHISRSNLCRFVDLFLVFLIGYSRDAIYFYISFIAK